MGVHGCGDLTDQECNRKAGDPEARRGEGEHQDRAHADLDDQVLAEATIATVDLKNGAVDAKQEPHSPGHQSQRGGPVAWDPQSAGQRLIQCDSEDAPCGHPEQAAAIQALTPQTRRRFLSFRGSLGDSAHDADQQRRADHGEHEEEAEQLRYGAVLVARQQPGDEDRAKDVEQVRHHSANGQWTRCHDPPN